MFYKCVEHGAVVAIYHPEEAFPEPPETFAVISEEEYDELLAEMMKDQEPPYDEAADTKTAVQILLGEAE